MVTATSHASDVGDAIVDPQRVHAQRVDGDVDDEPDPADEAEANQLKPVRRAAHPVQQAHMRTDLDRGGLLAHPPSGGGPSHGSWQSNQRPEVDLIGRPR